MSINDNLFVRQGPNIGDANENRLLQKVGGPETIRKTFQNNADGSVTMLHTRGPGARPEVITDSPEVTNTDSVWAWPWHGVWRAPNVFEPEPKAGAEAPTEMTGKGEAPGVLNFNFLPSVKSGAIFKSIPRPSTSKAGATWVNWAAISGGVLFGENVGMDVWLYTPGTKCYVVVLSYPAQFQVRLDIYSLDNWVSGIDQSIAQHFVRYDGAPTPYMSKSRPSSAARVAIKTLFIDLPEYYGADSSKITVKRSDVTQDGANLILAYEARGNSDQVPIDYSGWSFYYSSSYHFTIPSDAAENLQLEDQWVELNLIGDSVDTFAASVVTLRSGATIADPMITRTMSVENSSIAGTRAMSWPTPIPELVGQTLTCTISNTEHCEGACVIGMMYDYDNVASEVRFSAVRDMTMTSATSVSYVFGSSTHPYSFSGSVSQTENFTFSLINSLRTESEVVETSYTGTASGNISTPMNTEVFTGTHTHTIGDQTFTVSGTNGVGPEDGPRYGEVVKNEECFILFAPNYISFVGGVYKLDLNPAITTGTETAPYHGWNMPTFMQFNKGKTRQQWGDLSAAYSGGLLSYPIAGSPAPSSPIDRQAVGYRRFSRSRIGYGGIGYVSTTKPSYATGQPGSDDYGMSFHELMISREAFNCFTIGFLNEGIINPVSPAGFVADEKRPALHLTPHGWKFVTVSPETNAVYATGVANNEIKDAILYASAPGTTKQYV